MTGGLEDIRVIRAYLGLNEVPEGDWTAEHDSIVKGAPAALARVEEALVAAEHFLDYMSIAGRRERLERALAGLRGTPT